MSDLAAEKEMLEQQLREAQARLVLLEGRTVPYVPADAQELMEWALPQLLAVLHNGHGKEWRGRTAEHHEEHMAEHLSCATPFGMDDGNDTVDIDGQPHWAHAGIRLLMAAYQEKHGVQP